MVFPDDDEPSRWINGREWRDVTHQTVAGGRLHDLRDVVRERGREPAYDAKHTEAISES